MGCPKPAYLHPYGPAFGRYFHGGVGQPLVTLTRVVFGFPLFPYLLGPALPGEMVLGGVWNFCHATPVAGGLHPAGHAWYLA